MHDGSAPSPGEERPSTSITRLASADAQQALERIQASSLLAEGKVCLMSLEAIRDRLGTRWAARRDRMRSSGLSVILPANWTNTR